MAARRHAALGGAAVALFTVSATGLVSAADPNVSYPTPVITLLWVGLAASAGLGVLALRSDERPGLWQRFKWWRYRQKLHRKLRRRVGWLVGYTVFGKDPNLAARSITDPKQTEAAFLCEVHGPSGEFYYDELERRNVFMDTVPGQLPDTAREAADARFPSEFKPRGRWVMPTSGHLPVGTYHFLWFAWRSSGELDLAVAPYFLGSDKFSSETVQ